MGLLRENNGGRHDWLDRLQSGLAIIWLGLILFALHSFGQASFEAQVRGAVRDSGGSVIIGASVTITDVATRISSATNTDERGYYIFNGLHPAR